MLLEAAKSERVFPVYCFDPRQFSTTKIGYPKTGPFRTKFLIEAVNDLRNNLRYLGLDLIVEIGEPEEIIPNIAQEVGAMKVLCTSEVTDEELRTEMTMEKELWKSGRTLSRIWQSTLFHTEDLPWPILKLPEIFTGFRKQVEKESNVRATVSTPRFSKGFDYDLKEIPTLAALGVQEVKTDPRAVMNFIGGEKHAWKRLKHYLWDSNKLGHYKETRNGLIGADYSSKFSPWLATGCISPRTIYWEIKKYESRRVKNQSTYWLIFELMWRDYFRFLAKKYGNRIFKTSGIKEKNQELQKDQKLFEKWIDGETGVPFIDANMKELASTGFISNRGRQNVASFLKNDLKIDWTWGASYFESLLIDYDVASNWCNWNYVAGVGCDPRENRYFNIENQARKYDPNGEYVSLWLQENKQSTLFYG